MYEGSADNLAVRAGGTTPDFRSSLLPSAWRWVAPIILIVLILLAYVPALDAGFVGWDDDDLIFNTTNYRTWDADSLRWMFTTSYTGHFQPLTWISFSVDWALWHREAFGYHLTNVLFHLLSALTFYALVRRLLVAAGSSSTDIRSGPVVLASLFAAVMFAVHPLRAESVAWIAERRDVISGFFYILAIYCYARYAFLALRRGDDLASALDFQSASNKKAGIISQRHGGASLGHATQRRFFYVASVVVCAVSLLAKASAMTAPIVLLVLDVYPLRRRSRMGVSRRYLLLEKIPFFILATLAGMRALIAQAESGALREFASYGVGERFAQACLGLVFYVRKTLLPFHLGPLYEIPGRELLLGPMTWICAGVIIIGFGVAIAQRHKYPGILVALIIYGVVVSPVLGFAQSGPQLVADRYSYLSCLSLAALAGAGVHRLLWWLYAHRRPRLRAIAALAGVGIVAFLVNGTRDQADIWRSAQTLWSRGVRVSPQSAIAHTNYGDAMQVIGELGLAFRHYRKALSLNPKDAVAYHHLGDLALKMGDENTAIYYYHESLRIDPSRRRACFSLARLLVKRGFVRDAITILRDGAQRNPDALHMIDYLATLLAAHPDSTPRDAEEAIDWAMHVNSMLSFGHPPALMTLATAYAAVGRFDDAVNVAQHALELARQKSSEAVQYEVKSRLALFEIGKPYRLAITP